MSGSEKLKSVLLPEELVLYFAKDSLEPKLNDFYFSPNKESPEEILTHEVFATLNARIERCEYFANLLEPTFKEGSLALREIKALYENYKQGFLQFNPKDINELKEGRLDEAERLAIDDYLSKPIASDLRRVEQLQSPYLAAINQRPELMARMAQVQVEKARLRDGVSEMLLEPEWQQ